MTVRLGGQAPPRVELTSEMRARLASAAVDGCPVVVATVDGDGQPSLGSYATVHVHGVDQLAWWVGDPGALFLERLVEQPRVALLYRSACTTVWWQFHGRARVVDDEAERQAVWQGVPMSERRWDPEVRGRAVVAEVDRVIGRGLLMER